MESTTKMIDLYNLQISDINEQFKIVPQVSKVDRQLLLTLPNPKHNTVLPKYSHLKDLKMSDEETKVKLLIHIIQGASDCCRVKKNTSARVGNDGEPVAERKVRMNAYIPRTIFRFFSGDAYKKRARRLYAVV